mmetsp:Transcript_81486/g.136400  ORF Transcript_81486/g.136400 Transcript_81486/m.136400 type:complete len:381 (-) Transcript_81486:575-1717(-)
MACDFLAGFVTPPLRCNARCTCCLELPTPAIIFFNHLLIPQILHVLGGLPTSNVRLDLLQCAVSDGRHLQSPSEAPLREPGSDRPLNDASCQLLTLLLEVQGIRLCALLHTGPGQASPLVPLPRRLDGGGGLLSHSALLLQHTQPRTGLCVHERLLDAQSSLMQLLHTFEHVLTCVPLPTFVLSDLPGLVLLPGTLNGQRRVLAGPVLSFRLQDGHPPQVPAQGLHHLPNGPRLLAELHHQMALLLRDVAGQRLPAGLLLPARQFPFGQDDLEDCPCVALNADGGLQLVKGAGLHIAPAADERGHDLVSTEDVVEALDLERVLVHFVDLALHPVHPPCGLNLQRGCSVVLEQLCLLLHLPFFLGLVCHGAPEQALDYKGR